MSSLGEYDGFGRKVNSLIGKIKDACKRRDEYIETNPNIDKFSDEEYLELHERLNQAKQKLINISSTARARYKTPETFPEFAPTATHLIYECILADQQKGNSHQSMEVAELENLVAPVTIKVPAFNKNGNPQYTLIEDKDGNEIPLPEYEEQTVFALKGNSIQEVVQNLNKLVSNIVSQSNREIEELREEFENVSVPSLDKKEVQKLIQETVSNSIAEVTESTVLNVMQSPKGADATITNVSKAHYIQLFDEYMEDVKTLHFDKLSNGQYQPKTDFGKVLLLPAKITENGKTTDGVIWNTFTNYAWKELQEKFKKHNESTNNLLLKENPLGTNPNHNRTFINLLRGSTEIALNRISIDSADMNVPREAFFGKLPDNKFEEKKPEASLFDTLQQPSTIYGAITQPTHTALGNVLNSQAQIPQYAPVNPNALNQFGPLNAPMGQQVPTYSNYPATEQLQDNIAQIPVVVNPAQYQMTQPTEPPKFDFTL